MQRSLLFVLVVVLNLQEACVPKYAKHLGSYTHPKNAVPNYADYYFWAAHPDKYDPSDSVPAPLKDSYRYDSTVDVFFIHPTTLTQKENTSSNADINDARLNAKTDYSTILYQASAFNEFRVFAPRYRQAHIRSYYSAGTKATMAFDTAYEDVKNAFEYYLRNFNNNRPFILASHSQGTTHAIRLLKDFVENKPLAKKMVAAYLVGMYIPDTIYTALLVCKDSLQTSCICGWRSFQYGYVPDYVKRENGRSLVVNPILWTTDSLEASAKLNKGSVLRNFNKIYPSVANAKIHHGIVWINSPHFPGSFLLRMKNYHIADINFFYLNIRENLRQRVKAFKLLYEKQSASD